MKSPKKSRRRTTAAHRLRSVRIVLSGVSAVQVGKRYGDSPSAVATWVRRFKKNGAKGLEEAPHPGRPSKLTPSQMRQLMNFVAKASTHAQPLSGEQLSGFIKNTFRVTLTRQQARRILNRLISKNFSS